MDDFLLPKKKLAKIAGELPSTIHYWMKLGILVPKKTIGKGKIPRNLYDEEDSLERIYYIRKMQSVGKSIEDIVRLLPWYFDRMHISKYVKLITSPHHVSLIGDYTLINYNIKSLLSSPDNLIDAMEISCIDPYVHTEYINTFIKTGAFHRQIKSYMSDAPIILTRAVVESMLIPIPDEGTQRSIITKTKNMFKKINSISEQIMSMEDNIIDIFEVYLNQDGSLKTNNPFKGEEED